MAAQAKLVRAIRSPLRALNTRDARKLRFEMRHRALIRILFIQVTEGALKQTEDFRFVMFGFGADFN